MLGAVSGARTFGAWAGLAARERVANPWARVGLGFAAAGELASDKHPEIPARSDGPALVGRVMSGALAGRLIGGGSGAGVGAATAAASTYLSERGRALLGGRAPLPDPALAVAEDALVLGVAYAAAGPEPDPAPIDASDPDGAAPKRSPVTAAALGLVAGAAGTAAMTSAQVAFLRATDGEPSSTPGDVGRKLLRETTGARVPRRRQAAFNALMHGLYGTGWGAAFGAVRRRRCSPAQTALSGLGFGAAVWGVSLVELPLLGVAPSPWRQSPAALTPDLGFHLVYGMATAFVHSALVA